MTEKYNTTRDLHRIRTRGTPASTPEWDILQNLLGFAFTIQQEVNKLRRESEIARKLPGSGPGGLSQTGVHPDFQRIVTTAQNLTEATGAAIALGNLDSMVCVASTGPSSPPVGTRLDVRSGLSGECVRTGESAICVNAAADPRVDYQACRALGIRSMMYLPIRSQNEIVGVLGVFSSQALHFSQRDLNSLRFTETLVDEVLTGSADENETGVAALLRQVKRVHIEIGSSAPAAFESRPDRELEGSVLSADIPAPSSRPVQPTVVEKAAPVAAAVPVPVLPTRQPVVTPVLAEPKQEPVFLGRIIDESVQELEPDEEAQSLGEHRRIPVTIAATVVILFVAVIGWLTYMHYASLKPATTSTSSTVAPVTNHPVPPVISNQAEEVKPAKWLTPAIRFWSEGGHAVISVSLDKAIRYENSQLHNPERIYFDLHDISLTDIKGQVFPIEEGPISQIRIAEYVKGTTRIVFQLRNQATYTSALSTKPDLLVIDVLEQSPTTPAGKISEIVPPAIVPAQVEPEPSAGAVDGRLTVVIDPGHGGRDLGTTNPTGLREKDLSLDVALKLGKLLKKGLDANVIYTRSDDRFVPLTKRADLANRSHADFFISIHANSSSIPTVRGIETFYFKSSSEALAVVDESGATVPRSAADASDTARGFASDVQEALLNGLSDAQQTMRDRGIKPASFVVLKDAQMPAVLAEISFITSDKDARRLTSSAYRARIAEALYRGISSHVSRREAKTAASLKIPAPKSGGMR